MYHLILWHLTTDLDLLLSALALRPLLDYTRCPLITCKDYRKGWNWGVWKHQQTQNIVSLSSMQGHQRLKRVVCVGMCMGGSVKLVYSFLLLLINSNYKLSQPSQSYYTWVKICITETCDPLSTNYLLITNTFHVYDIMQTQHNNPSQVVWDDIWLLHLNWHLLNTSSTWIILAHWNPKKKRSRQTANGSFLSKRYLFQIHFHN